MAITTGNFAKALWPGINSWYGKGYGEFSVEHTDLFDQYTSRKNFEEDMGITSFGLAAIKGEGASVTYDNEQQGFLTRYSHVTYALGFIITREMVEDDLYDVAGEKKAKALAFSMRQTKENIAANVYNRAFNTSYTGGDGKALLRSDHPNVAGGTWSNVIGTAADISEAALEQALIDIGKWTNDRGLRVAVHAKAIVVPVDLDFEINKILKTEYEVGTNNNTVNIVRGRFPGGVKINHYLTDTDAWFIRTDAPDGMKHFTRRDAEFGVDDDFDTENAKYKATERYSFGWTDPKALYGSAGA